MFAASLATDDEIHGFVAQLGRKLRADYAMAHSIPKKNFPEVDAFICGHAARMMWSKRATLKIIAHRLLR